MNNPALAAFLAAYTCSGLAGLIYEVSWTRLLTLHIGHTTAAASAVVSAFMGGLALGAAVAGRLAGRLTLRRCLYAYAILEASVAAIALLAPGGIAGGDAAPAVGLPGWSARVGLSRGASRRILPADPCPRGGSWRDVPDRRAMVHGSKHVAASQGGRRSLRAEHGRRGSRRAPRRLRPDSSGGGIGIDLARRPRQRCRCRGRSRHRVPGGRRRRAAARSAAAAEEEFQEIRAGCSSVAGVGGGSCAGAVRVRLAALRDRVDARAGDDHRSHHVCVRRNAGRPDSRPRHRIGWRRMDRRPDKGRAGLARHLARRGGRGGYRGLLSRAAVRSRGSSRNGSRRRPNSTRA